MTTRAQEAAAEWEQWRHTRALLVLDADVADRPGPLSGLSVTVKDVYPAVGLPARGASLALDDRPARSDTPVVAALRALGAAIVAKSNCAEFGIGVTTTDTRLGGRVVHPFDPAWLPGGSSGGDAVAVATGTVDVAVASDYGGSIRWPAQALGVCGLRTTAGLLPRDGRLPGLATGATPTLQDELEVVGFLAARPDILARVVACVTPAESGPSLGPGRRRALAVSADAGVGPVHPDVAAAGATAAAA
ncbi:MAG: amidase, partial [Acidobacteriota bacterium]|nr:amidase [Acidobacteriota bacterium]